MCAERSPHWAPPPVPAQHCVQRRRSISRRQLQLLVGRPRRHTMTRGWVTRRADEASPLGYSSGHALPACYRVERHRQPRRSPALQAAGHRRVDHVRTLDQPPPWTDVTVPPTPVLAPGPHVVCGPHAVGRVGYGRRSLTATNQDNQWPCAEQRWILWAQLVHRLKLPGKRGTRGTKLIGLKTVANANPAPGQIPSRSHENSRLSDRP
jgi:hypothetical protein